MQYHNVLNSIVYYKLSGECRALYLQTFALARLRLKSRLDAFLANGGSLASAYIVSDLDETVLDNSPIREFFIETGRNFHQETWSAWCQSKGAVGTPGAKEFLNYVASLGVNIVYVTSRIEIDRQATADTLTNPDPGAGLGFPLPNAGNDPTKTFLFMGGMALQPGGAPTKKGDQYAFLKQRFGTDPLLQLGDNLSDHDPVAYGDGVRFDQRYARAGQEASRWGDDRIVFPNPVYGGWENSLRITTPAGDAVAADEIPPAVYTPNPVRPSVSPQEAPKLALLPRWSPN